MQALVSRFPTQALLSYFLLWHMSEWLLAASPFVPPAQTREPARRESYPSFINLTLVRVQLLSRSNCSKKTGELHNSKKLLGLVSGSVLASVNNNIGLIHLQARGRSKCTTLLQVVLL